MKKRLSLLIIAWITLVAVHATPPKLVLQLVIDQLRGDLLDKYQGQFGEHGFNYLRQHGLDYHNAHHPHASTVTCVGHATIATGSYPALHGLVGNSWFDLKTGREVHCTEDKTAAILPTIRSQKPVVGSSPKHLMSSTLADEIILAKKGQAFAVSFKDRAAITLAGHAGKAFWFDKINGGFISSRHYYADYPQWVNRWNEAYHPVNQSWELSLAKTQYTFANSPRFKNHFPTFNQDFPHSLGEPSSENYYKFLSMTPKADELTADFAKALLQNQHLGLGQGKTDYLAISFSAVDAIGHQFGPNSLESEDNLLRLDKTLASLLAAIDKQVGLDNCLIVLTADHGITDAPAYLSAHQFKELDDAKLPAIKAVLEDTLAKEFQLPPSALKAIILPYVYLNHELIRERKLSLPHLRQSLADRLTGQPGIFKAYGLPLTTLEPDWLNAKVSKMAYPFRSGDIYLLAPPNQSLGDKGTERVSHGSPWEYDSYVPLIFASGQFKPKRLTQPVSTTDIAPTLAMLLGIKAPSASVGRPLPTLLKLWQ